MSGVHRTAEGIRASARSFVRDPFTLAMLAVLPLVSIEMYGVAMGQFPDVGVFAVEGSLATTGRITGAVFATGALAGVLGLFQMISARSADGRLGIAGFRGVELVGARFVVVAAASVLVALVGTGALAVLVDGPVRAPAVVVLGLALAGGIYGSLGILVGTVLPRELEGSLLLVILADVDNVFASGLFGIDQSITNLAPLSHPHAIVTEGLTQGSVASGHLLPALSHLAVFGAAGVVAYTLRIESGGGS